MILAILQARCSSTRLPNKVLKPLLGQAMLLRQIERVSRVRGIDHLLVATSSDGSDDPLAELCRDADIDCYRGSLDDVLDRFYQASIFYRPDYVVRLTGDCPLADPMVIDKVIDAALANGVDYASNCLQPTYPDGLDVEVIRYTVLTQAWQEAALPSEREHVTPYINKRPERYRCLNVSNEQDLSHLRWTVDNAEDFMLVDRIYQALYPQNPEFTTADILALLAAHPDWVELNNHIQRNEGLAKSLKADFRDSASGVHA